MISSIDPAPSVISCGGQSALFLSACPQGFQEIFQQGAKGPEKNRCITPAARNAICLIRYGPRSLVCLALTAAPLCSRMALRNAGHPASPQILPSSHRLTGKSFWKGGARGGRTFFQKGFPPRKLFSLHIFNRLPAIPKTKKSPMDRGQKKTPSRCELQGGLEQSLAAAYFPT